MRLAEEQALARARHQARPPAAKAPKPSCNPRVRAPQQGSDCGISTSGLGAVKPHVRAAAQFLGCRFGEPTMYGVAGRAGTSDHPSGRAVDFMVDPATGDRLAACALKNRAALGITYVIWRQRINFGSGWQLDGRPRRCHRQPLRPRARLVRRGGGRVPERVLSRPR